VLVERGHVVGRFQSLMNAGVRMPPFIEQYTGMGNAMVQAAPPAAQVMADALRFVQGAPLTCAQRLLQRMRRGSAAGRM
jgi:DNA polymerase-3 subunit epsilon